jgi:hypothetical protein
LGFAISNAATQDLRIIPLMYVLPVVVCALSLAMIGGARFDAIRFLVRRLFFRRFGGERSAP